MARNHKRDYDELPVFAKSFAGMRAVDCIEEYAKRRKVVSHRIGKVFWHLVDDEQIAVVYVNGIFFIK